MTQYLDWKVGDRVVCVDDTGAETVVYPFPKVGTVCTISWIGYDGGTLGVDLVEYPCPPSDTILRGWDPEYFRKVQPRKTSIAVFERLLNTQNNEVETA